MERPSYRTQTLAALQAAGNQPLSPRLRESLGANGFEARRDLIAFQRDPAGDKDRKDAVLVALLAARKASPKDREPFELLLEAMFPVVDRFFRRRVARARAGALPDASFGTGNWTDETWAQLIALFSRVTLDYPLDRRPRKIARNLQGLLQHALDDHDEEARDLQRSEKQLAEVVAPLVEPTGSPDDDGDRPPLGLFDLTRDEEPAAKPADDEVELLDRRLREAGLDPVTRTIVVGVIAHDRTFTEIAGELRMNRNTAKARFRRALDRVGKFLRRVVPLPANPEKACTRITKKRG